MHLSNNRRNLDEYHLLGPFSNRINAIMHNFNWDYIRYFLAVVAEGSATQAAAKLGVNQSTVSRRLSSLEEELGARLFE